MTKLSKIYEEVNNRGEITGMLEIAVDYDPDTNSIEPLTVRAWDKDHFKGIELTGIFTEHLSGHLDAIIDEIDWQEVYRSERLEREVEHAA